MGNFDLNVMGKLKLKSHVGLIYHAEDVRKEFNLVDFSIVSTMIDFRYSRIRGIFHTVDKGEGFIIVLDDSLIIKSFGIIETRSTNTIVRTQLDSQFFEDEDGSTVNPELRIHFADKSWIDIVDVNPLPVLNMNNSQVVKCHSLVQSVSHNV